MSVRVAIIPRRRGGVGTKTLLGGVLCSALLILGGMIVTRPQIAEPKVERVLVGTFETVRVPVPARAVAIGTKLKDVPLQFIDYPTHQLPKGALTAVDSYLEAAAIAPLPASLPIFSENLSHNAVGTNPVIERIPEGMRAMTLRVDATAAVEGWAGSGAIVDVLLVLENKTTVVAEKVKILSAERSVAPVEGSSAPSVPTTVTLLVTQEQCLAINTAIPRGRIAFALRAARDSGAWGNTSFLAQHLEGGPEAPREEIKGFVSVGGKGFALSGSRWIESETKPESFRLLKKEGA
jgi:Flp pilus assembly protein CpaB